MLKIKIDFSPSLGVLSVFNNRLEMVVENI